RSVVGQSLVKGLDQLLGAFQRSAADLLVNVLNRHLINASFASGASDTEVDLLPRLALQMQKHAFENFGQVYAASESLGKRAMHAIEDSFSQFGKRAEQALAKAREFCGRCIALLSQIE